MRSLALQFCGMVTKKEPAGMIIAQVSIDSAKDSQKLKGSTPTCFNNLGIKERVKLYRY
jgi:hypothetical protein